MSDEPFVESIEETCAKMTTDHCQKTELYGIPIASLVIDYKERLCLAQISNTLLKKFSYNEIHNRRVALGITCVQCTPVQLEILRRAGAMPISSRRCGMITKHEAERLVKSFLEEIQPVKLPDNFAFDVKHTCSWGCQGNFIPGRYNSSRAKCIKCKLCPMYLSPNKFIFHSHRLPDSKYQHPDAANFNSWRRHIKLANEDPSNELMHVWEDVKAMFNGGSRKRSLLTMKTSGTSDIPTGTLTPSAKRTGMRFDTAPSAYSSIRTPVYPFMASQFMPKPFQNVGPEAYIPLIPPHRMRMESVGRPDYSPSFPMSSWKMAPFWLNSQMMGGSYLGKVGPGGHDAAWHELHGAPFRPLSSSDDLDVPPVTKMLNPHRVSAFTPVEYQRSMEELEAPLLKMSSPSRRESPKSRRLHIADKYSASGPPSDNCKKFGLQGRMDIAAADNVNITKSSDTFEEDHRMGFGVPIHARARDASSDTFEEDHRMGFGVPIHARARDASLQPETRTSIPILKVENRQEDTVPRRYSSTVQEQDIKQLTRSELEAKLEEAQTTLSNLTSSNTSSTK